MVTASDAVGGTENLLRKFHKIAPNARVIGFKGVLTWNQDTRWSNKFWSYAIKGEEFGVAAGRAAKDAGIGKLLVVDGDQDVYLHSLEEKYVDMYGFTMCGWNGFAKPTWKRPLSFFGPDTLNTFRDVEDIGDKLKAVGYVPRLHPNKSAEDAKKTLRGAEVFFFHGHGLPDSIMFHDDQCIDSYISLEELPSELPKLKLVVLLACKTAKRDEFDWREAIREWLEKLQRDLERRVTDWWEEQKRRAIEEFLRQLCGAPAGLVIVSSYQFWRWRKRSKERS